MLRWGGLVMVLLVSPVPAQAQLSGFNLFEFQLGNVPFTEPDDLTTGYDQLNVSYDHGDVRAFVRAEHSFTRFRERAHVVMRVYDLLGNAVRTLADGQLPAGRQTIAWDGTGAEGRAAAAGVYFYRLRTPSHTASRVMTVVR